MTALLKEQPAKRRVIRWTHAEYVAVARRYFALQDTTSMFMPAMAELAQQCLPEERRRPFTQSKSLVHLALPELKRAYEQVTPEQASADREAARQNFAIVEESRVEEFELPTHKPVPKPVEMPPVLGPLELALQAMVGNAVQDRVGVLVEAMREEMRQQREEFQSLLAQQYDAMMCYWDPAYKEQHELKAEFVDDHTLPPLLEQVRMRQRRVLVSAGESSMYNGVTMYFKGIEFTFLDATNKRKVSSGAFYDLVVCTRFTSHSAMKILRNLHGNKVVIIDGGMTLLVGTIKKHLGL